MLIFLSLFSLPHISPPPQANEADQKAAQVAQDEVSNMSNTCGIPLLAEADKQPLFPLTL